MYGAGYQLNGLQGGGMPMNFHPNSSPSFMVQQMAGAGVGFMNPGNLSYGQSGNFQGRNMAYNDLSTGGRGQAAPGVSRPRGSYGSPLVAPSVGGFGNTQANALSRPPNPYGGKI